MIHSDIIVRARSNLRNAYAMGIINPNKNLIGLDRKNLGPIRFYIDPNISDAILQQMRYSHTGLSAIEHTEEMDEKVNLALLLENSILQGEENERQKKIDKAFKDIYPRILDEQTKANGQKIIETVNSYVDIHGKGEVKPIEDLYDGGRITILSGPPGVGKGSITSSILRKGAHKFVFVNTRDRRPGEENGTTYFYIYASKDTMDKLAHEKREIEDKIKRLQEIQINIDRAITKYDSKDRECLNQNNIKNTIDELSRQLLSLEKAKEEFDKLKQQALSEKKDTFKKLQDDPDVFVAKYEVYGSDCQGVPRLLFDLAKAGEDIIVETDINLAGDILKNAKEKEVNCQSVFLLPPSFEKLARRLIGRGTEATKDIEKRLLNSIEIIEQSIHIYKKKELSRQVSYDRFIVNKDNELLSTIKFFEKVVGYRTKGDSGAMMNESLRDVADYMAANNICTPIKENPKEQLILYEEESMSKYVEYIKAHTSFGKNINDIIEEAVTEITRDKDPKVKTSNIGIVMGNFNPISYRHLTEAYVAIIEKKLNGVIFLPDPDIAANPLMISFEHRFKMIKRALKEIDPENANKETDNPWIQLSEIRARIKGKFGGCLNIFGKNDEEIATNIDIAALRWLMAENPHINWSIITRVNKANLFAEKKQNALILNLLKCGAEFFCVQRSREKLTLFNPEIINKSDNEWLQNIKNKFSANIICPFDPPEYYMGQTRRFFHDKFNIENFDVHPQTVIRSRLMEKKPVLDWIPGAVIDYIYDHKLEESYALKIKVLELQSRWVQAKTANNPEETEKIDAELKELKVLAEGLGKNGIITSPVNISLDPEKFEVDPSLKIVSNHMPLTAASGSKQKVLIISPELFPLTQEGELGQFISAFPTALQANNIDARVLIPKYGIMDLSGYNLKVEGGTSISINNAPNETRFHSANVGGIPVYFVDIPAVFGDGSVYAPGTELLRSYFLSQSAMKLSCLPENWIPDIIHGHNWQSALAMVYLNQLQKTGSPLSGVASLFTVHDVTYQGIFDRLSLYTLGLGEQYMDVDKGLGHHGKANILKGGMQFANFTNTISSAYLQEIIKKEFGYDLEGFISYLIEHEKISAVSHGIDFEKFNPFSDKALPHHYDANNFEEGKKENKTSLQKMYGLNEKPDAPLIAYIERFSNKGKGINLIIEQLKDLMGHTKAQFIIAGEDAPEEEYTNKLKGIQNQYPGRIRILPYDPEVSRKVMAGADIFVAPSLSEPSSLNSMIALRYGTIPVARAVGALKETVKNYSADSGDANGFSFDEFSGKAMVEALNLALKIYHKNQETWKTLIQRGMRKDNSMEATALEYINLYGRAIEIAKRNNATI